MAKKTELTNAEKDDLSAELDRRKFLKKTAYYAPTLLVLGTLGSIKSSTAASINCSNSPVAPRCPPHP